MTSARKMTPIVFWASCRPWPRASAAAETVCIIRNPRITLCGLRRRKIHMIDSITRNAAQKPNSGERTIGMRTFSTILAQSTAAPPPIAAPTRPPMRACEEDDGRPNHQVMRFQVIAPSRPAITMTSPWLSLRWVDHVLDGVGDLLAEQGADEVHDRGQGQRDPGRQRPGGDRRRDGVGGVVEAVGVVEGERDDDDGDHDRQGEGHAVSSP